MTTIERFDLLEQYKAQDVARREWVSKYQKQIDELNAKIREKKIELELLVTKEIQDNSDFTKEKVKLRKDIDSLKDDLSYLLSEQESAMKIVNDKFNEISKVEVVKEWQSFRAEIYAKFSPEVIQKAELGMNLLMSAYYEQELLKAQYKDLTDEVMEISKLSRELGESSALNYVSNPFGYFNTVTERIQKVIFAVRELNSNDPQFPDGFQYIERLSEIKGEVK